MTVPIVGALLIAMLVVVGVAIFLAGERERPQHADSATSTDEEPVSSATRLAEHTVSPFGVPGEHPRGSGRRSDDHDAGGNGAGAVPVWAESASTAGLGAPRPPRQPVSVGADPSRGFADEPVEVRGRVADRPPERRSDIPGGPARREQPTADLHADAPPGSRPPEPPAFESPSTEPGPRPPASAPHAATHGPEPVADGAKHEPGGPGSPPPGPEPVADGAKHEPGGPGSRPPGPEPVADVASPPSDAPGPPAPPLWLPPTEPGGPLTKVLHVANLVDGLAAEFPTEWLLVTPADAVGTWPAGGSVIGAPAPRRPGTVAPAGSDATPWGPGVARRPPTPPVPPGRPGRPPAPNPFAVPAERTVELPDSLVADLLGGSTPAEGAEAGGH